MGVVPGRLAGVIQDCQKPLPDIPFQAAEKVATLGQEMCICLKK
jgi:hypothetical protein